MIPLAPIERIVKKSGVERISKKALEEITKFLDNVGLELAKEAAQVARHAKRKTILKQDIQLIKS